MTPVTGDLQVNLPNHPLNHLLVRLLIYRLIYDQNF